MIVKEFAEAISSEQAMAATEKSKQLGSQDAKAIETTKVKSNSLGRKQVCTVRAS